MKAFNFTKDINLHEQAETLRKFKYFHKISRKTSRHYVRIITVIMILMVIKLPIKKNNKPIHFCFLFNLSYDIRDFFISYSSFSIHRINKIKNSIIVCCSLLIAIL
mgnify:CR=1 FL=1